MQQKLGQLVVANTSSVNNLTTATPFAIPCGVDSLLLLASASPCYGLCSKGTSSLAATTSTGQALGTSNYQMPCVASAPSGPNDGSNVVAVYNNSGGQATVDVWAIYA